MPTKTVQNLYAKKKRRMIGEMMHTGELKNSNGWLSITGSTADSLINYESSGLVVAVSGSGSLPQDHQQCREAAVLAEYVARQGGIIMNGGRATGIMLATTTAAGGKSVGIIFPELQKEAAQAGQTIMVNAPQPRIELMATCAPIVVLWRGGLGTLMVLMRAIVHLRNRQFHPDQAPQIVFVSNYWIGLLTTMMNMGCLPREFLTALEFFDTADQIIEKIPKL